MLALACERTCDARTITHLHPSSPLVLVTLQTTKSAGEACRASLTPCTAKPLAP